MEKKLEFKIEEIQDMTGKGYEFLVDKDGKVRAQFIDGKMVPPNESDVNTKEAA